MLNRKRDPMDFACNSETFRRGPMWWNGSEAPENGEKKKIEEHYFVFYDGYWIRYYQPPEESLEARKNLIESLTRRTFHHTEHGINTPGHALEGARAAYDRESDPRKKRVNAAMLAGALFNRATDIFRTVVELGANGVHISRDNELMQECGQCFKEALELGKQVKHYSGQEGIDELWGEPFRAFTAPRIEQFYESRFIKIAQAMRNIDHIADRLKSLLDSRALTCLSTTSPLLQSTNAKPCAAIQSTISASGRSSSQPVSSSPNSPVIPTAMHKCRHGCTAPA